MLTRRTLFASLGLALSVTGAEAATAKKKKPARLASKLHPKTTRLAKATSHKPLSRS